jgi:hypothetical protein
MNTVAGADEAGRTPGGADRTQQTIEQTRPADGSEPRPEQAQPATAPVPEQGQAADTEQPPEKPGFGERGSMRRRARFLRKARELAYRDLGGLVFDLHRFGQRNDPLVLAKLAMLREIDRELRGLEQALGERRSVTVLREVGIAACPRCAALHGSDDRFCPNCGLAFGANVDRPLSTAPLAPQAPAPTAQPVATRPAPVAPSPAAPQPGSAAAPTTAPAPAPTAPTAPAPSATPPTTPRAAPVPVKARGDEDEQTKILRPPARDE